MDKSIELNIKQLAMNVEYIDLQLQTKINSRWTWKAITKPTALNQNQLMMNMDSKY